MFILNNYREKEALMNKLADELADMEHNKALTEARRIEGELRNVLISNRLTNEDAIRILDPNNNICRHIASGSTLPAPKPAYEKVAPRPIKKKRQAYTERKVRRYQNPFSGQIIETKGGPVRDMQRWRDQYGHDVVEGWRIEDAS